MSSDTATPHVRTLFELSEQVALVTGGSRGLGLEIATGLGEAGASVAITARRESWLTTAEDELSALGINTLPLVCDVSDANQVRAAVERTLKEFGRIDVLVNNAGISWAAPAEQMTVEKWREVIDVNATGCFLMSQAVGRTWIEGGRPGAIINIASITGLVGTRPDVLDTVGYAASKGAIVSFTRDLAVKWAPHGIRVNAVAPGFFETRLSARVLERGRSQIEQATPMGRIGRPGELKGVVVFLASAASSYMTGQVIVVDGGTTAE
jgi:NAD(P)-dependent dehydrogenase (short-subunit alcohol dehydrogenase family)